MWQALDNSQAAGGALFDLKIAFSRAATLWSFPAFFINCIRSLCKRAWCSIFIRGSDAGGFWALRGVEQGDPLSGLLFTFAFDSIIRYIAELTTLHAVYPTAFADALAIAADL
eukprot:4125484-Pyramimonas_sp.AAC.1